MITILSPTKGLNFKNKENLELKASTPLYMGEVRELVQELKKYEIPNLMELMSISEELAILNFTRFQDFNLESFECAKPAIFTYEGEAYKGLDAHTLSKEGIEFAQEHLRILSGLYGVLRPLDLINEYRLEMLTKLNTSRGKNLYEYWGDIIENNLREALANSEEKVLVNLASEEYSKAAKVKKLSKEFKVITPVFKEFKQGKYKVVTVYAKRARGLMARYIMENAIDEVEKLKDFSAEDYEFNENLSEENLWVFTR